MRAVPGREYPDVPTTQRPATPIEVERVARQRNYRDLVAQIREMIAAGRLRPGDRLPPERDLAATLGVSRGTVREALRALEAGGVLGLRSGASGGAFVLPGSPDTVVTSLCDLYHLGAIDPAQLTEARIWIEASVVGAAALRATPQELADMDLNVRLAEAAEREGDFPRRVALHRDFHLLLAKAARNPVMLIMMQGVLEVTQQFVRTIGYGDNPYTIPSRRRLLAHLHARDAQAAVTEMSQFLSRLHSQYLERWNEHRTKRDITPTP